MVRFLLPLFTPTNGYLSVNSSIAGTEVLIENNKVGTSPYQGTDLKVGDHKLTLRAKFATASSKFFGNREITWSNLIRLGNNTLSVVNVDFGPSEVFNAVEILGLRKSTTSISIASEPTSAKIELDGKEIGQTPLVQEVSAGVHRLKISREGYLPRQIDINVPAGHQTIIQLNLSANPLPKTVEKIADEGNLTLYSLTTDIQKLIDKTQVWAEGVWFFQERGSGLETKFDALIDSSGRIYYYDQGEFERKTKEAVNVGYLSKPSEKSLNRQAQAAWEKLAPKPKMARIEILPTPTGSLNVRSGPSQSNQILTTVKPGGKYDLLKEQPGWYQIQVGTLSGWVSSQYAKKI